MDNYEYNPITNTWDRVGVSKDKLNQILAAVNAPMVFAGTVIVVDNGGAEANNIAVHSVNEELTFDTHITPDETLLSEIECAPGWVWVVSEGGLSHELGQLNTGDQILIVSPTDGQGLHAEVLNNIVPIGYQFMGVADTTTNDNDVDVNVKCAWITGTPGTYTGLDNIVVDDNEFAVILREPSGGGVPVYTKKTLNKYVLTSNIDDTQLANPAENSVAKAEDTMQLKAKLEGVTASETKQSYTLQSGYVNHDGSIKTTSSNHVVIALGTAKKVRFLGQTIASPSGDNLSYAFWNSDTYIDASTVVSSTYYDQRTGSESQPKEYSVSVPPGATHIAISVGSKNSSNFYCYLQSGENVTEAIKFKGGEVVKDTTIKDTVFDNANTDVLSARQGMETAHKLGDVSFREEKAVLYESGENRNVFTGIVMAANAPSGYTVPCIHSGFTTSKYVVIAVEGFTRVRFLTKKYKSTATVYCGYAFYGANNYNSDAEDTDGGFLKDNTGWKRYGVYGRNTTNDESLEEVTVDVPKTAKYLKITCKDGNLTLNNFYCYLMVGNTVKELHEITEHKINQYVDITEGVTVGNGAYYNPANPNKWNKTVNYTVKEYNLESFKDDDIYLNAMTAGSGVSKPRIVFTSQQQSTWPTESEPLVNIQELIGYDFNSTQDYDNEKITIPQGAAYLYLIIRNNETVIPSITVASNRITELEDSVSNLQENVEDINKRFTDEYYEKVTNYLEISGHGVTTNKAGSAPYYELQQSTTSNPTGVKKYRLYPVVAGVEYYVSFDFTTNNNGSALYSIYLVSAETDIDSETFNDVQVDSTDALKYAFGYYSNNEYVSPPNDMQLLGRVFKTKYLSLNKINRSKITIPEGCKTIILNVFNETTTFIERVVKEQYSFEDILNKIDELDNNVQNMESLPPYYYKNNYFQNRCKKVNDLLIDNLENYISPNYENTYDKGSYLDSFVFFTDPHYGRNYKMAGRIAKEIVECCGIKNVICGGDVNGGAATEYGSDVSVLAAMRLMMDDFNEVLKSIDESGADFYLLRGNHDFSLNKEGYRSPMPQTDDYKDYFLPRHRVYSEIMKRNRISRAIFGEGTGDTCCYYYDNPQSHLRYVFLDTTDTNRPAAQYENSMTYGFTKEQLQWAINTIKTTPSDYNVILLSHIYSERLLASGQKSSNWNLLNTVYGCIDRLIDAVNNKTSYSEFSGSVVENFSGFAPNIILHETGHRHSDMVVYRGYWGATVISDHYDRSRTGGMYSSYLLNVGGTSKWPGGTSTKGTIYENALDAVVIDDSNISMIRFGVGLDRILCREEIELSESSMPLTKHNEDSIFVCYDSDDMSYPDNATHPTYYNYHANITESGGEYTLNKGTAGYSTLLEYSETDGVVWCYGVKTT